MPRQAADLEEALKKKGGLTLSQLANYDDLITDALVDRVYFWSTIRKLKAKYYPSRGVQEETVCAIVRENVVWEKDAQTAHKKLLELPGIAKYARGLKSEDEKEHFERHLRKYINVYLPDCPFEVATTNRYTITTAEACVKARKTIRKGDVIKYLTGIQVEMTEKEEEELSSRTDFSIVLSSRRKRPSLFLGPARFANHDCDSNARLNTSGPHGIHIVAVKDILPGQEITVTYGEDYFGIDNCECLCATCESVQRNGWDPQGPWLKDDSSDEESEAGDEADTADMVVKREPAQHMTQYSVGSEIAVLGKRKRGEDCPVGSPGVEEHVTAKRKRGRPRKDAKSAPFSRPEAPDGSDDARTQGVYRPRSPDRRQNSLDEVSPREHSEASSTQQGEGALSIKDENGQIIGRALSSDGVRKDKDPARQSHRNPISSSRITSHSTDATLEKIWQLLNNVADRTLAQPSEGRLPSAMHAQAGASIDDTNEGISTPVRTAADMVNERSLPLSRRNATSLGTGLLTPPYANRLSRSPESSSEKPPLTPRSLADTSKLKVPTVKKERSSSSLRNVVNAVPEEEATDIFSIPASPGPADPPKRKRGRPRKYPRPDESEDATDSSSSCLSQTGDSVSSASQASSATSVETFAAGNIAYSICQMLVTDAEVPGGEAEAKAEVAIKIEEAEEGDEPEEVAPPPVPRQTRRQAAAEAAKAEEAAKAAKAAAKQERQRGRTRASLRTSPRKAPTSNSTSRPPIQSIEAASPVPSNVGPPGENYHRGSTVRKPGDYHLTPLLLSTPYHRWVECRNCDEFFVQGEAYLTRIACPRCERHSKLYGYYWPKSEKEGRGDDEERVKDHRTIHRFVDAEGEKGERKGRRGLAEVLRERESERLASERAESEEMEAEVKGKRQVLRSSPGGRRRRLRMTM